MIDDHTFDDALRVAFLRQEARRRATDTGLAPLSPDALEAEVEALAEALKPSTPAKARARSSHVRLRMPRRMWPLVHEHCKQARISLETIRSASPSELVIRLPVEQANLLRVDFPDLETLP